MKAVANEFGLHYATVSRIVKKAGRLCFITRLDPRFLLLSISAAYMPRFWFMIFTIAFISVSSSSLNRCQSCIAFATSFFAADNSFLILAASDSSFRIFINACSTSVPVNQD
jgi:hypothetical protein